MTGTNPTGADWGARHDSRRRRRRWAVAAVIALAATLFVWLAPNIDTHPAAPATRLGTVTAFLASVGAVLAFSWRDRDEVERRTAINSLAVIGLASLFLVPIARMSGAVLAIGDPVLTAWAASAIAGLIAYFGQRLRR